MKLEMKSKVLVLIMLVSFSLTLSAQERFSLNGEKSKLIIKGTSTVHDWEMEANNLKSHMLINKESGGLVINQVSFVCPAEKILSDNSIMDSKTHNAIKAEKHPEITFKMKSIENLNTNGNVFTGEIAGLLSIAGTTKTVKIRFQGNILANAISVKGEVPLKLSDFNIEPPTAMLGALKTGNEIKVNYDFWFENKELVINK